MPVVATNTAANSALRFLNNNSATASGSVGKLASGSRIVKASDDAAGLAIGTRLNADVTALTQAGINASQGASVVQVALAELLFRNRSAEFAAVFVATTGISKFLLREANRPPRPVADY